MADPLEEEAARLRQAREAYGGGGEAAKNKRSLSAVPTALGGAGLLAIAMTLLDKYPQAIERLLDWGPAMVIVAMGGIFIDRLAPPFIESQRSIAVSLSRLAATVEHSATSQHDLVLAMQVNSDKLEQVRGTLGELETSVRRLEERVKP